MRRLIKLLENSCNCDKSLSTSELLLIYYTYILPNKYETGCYMYPSNPNQLDKHITEAANIFNELGISHLIDPNHDNVINPTCIDEFEYHGNNIYDNAFRTIDNIHKSLNISRKLEYYIFSCICGGFGDRINIGDITSISAFNEVLDREFDIFSGRLSVNEEYYTKTDLDEYIIDKYGEYISDESTIIDNRAGMGYNSFVYFKLLVRRIRKECKL